MLAGMSARGSLRLVLAALAVCAWTACKDKGHDGVTSDSLCSQLAKACGDNDKHVEKIFDSCKLATPKQIQKGCTDKLTTLYDCYEKQLCGKADRVWALDDLDVLADRKKECTAEREALRACVAP